MPETHFWPGGNPGDPVPAVEAADLKAVWDLYRDLDQKHPGKQFGVGITVIERVCTPGADVQAVTYRSGMLQVLQITCKGRLAPWIQGAQPHEAVFNVAARILMKWMGIGVPQSSFPFDVDGFFQELRKDSP